MNLTARLTEITEAVADAVADSALEDRDYITVSNDGNAVKTAAHLSAGAIIVYPVPALAWPAPRVVDVVWTIAVAVETDSSVADAERLATLLDLLVEAKVIRFGSDRATPTDFELEDGQKITGYTVTRTEQITRS